MKTNTGVVAILGAQTFVLSGIMLYIWMGLPSGHPQMIPMAILLCIGAFVNLGALLVIFQKKEPTPSASPKEPESGLASPWESDLISKK